MLISVVPSGLGKSRTELKLEGHQENCELSVRLKTTLRIYNALKVQTFVSFQISTVINHIKSEMFFSSWHSVLIFT